MGFVWLTEGCHEAQLSLEGAGVYWDPTPRQGGGLGDGRDRSSLPLSFSSVRAGQEVRGCPITVCPVTLTALLRNRPVSRLGTEACEETGPGAGRRARMGPTPGSVSPACVCLHGGLSGAHKLKTPENFTLITGPEVW